MVRFSQNSPNWFYISIKELSSWRYEHVETGDESILTIGELNGAVEVSTKKGRFKKVKWPRRSSNSPPKIRLASLGSGGRLGSHQDITGKHVVEMGFARTVAGA